MTKGIDHVRTEQNAKMVEAMTAYGVTQGDIAAVLGVSLSTIKTHYRDELDTAIAKANSKIAERLYKKALDGDTTSMIFWLKTRARWSETVKQELSGPNNGPIQHEATVTHKILSLMTTEQLQAIEAEGAPDGSNP